MNNIRLYAPSAKTSFLSPPTDRGFTIVEVMIVVAILGILSAIAVPVYNNYTTNAKVAVATATINQFPVLIETYRAENAMMCPACNANGTHTYNYTENNAGVVTADTITPNLATNPAALPFLSGFRVKEASTAPSLYDYQVVFNVPCITAPVPAGCTEEAVVTALPHANAPAVPASNPIR